MLFPDAARLITTTVWVGLAEPSSSSEGSNLRSDPGKEFDVDQRERWTASDHSGDVHTVVTTYLMGNCGYSLCLIVLLKIILTGKALL